MQGNQYPADPVGSQMIVKLAVAFARSTLGEQALTAHHPRGYMNGMRFSRMPTNFMGLSSVRKPRAISII